jgi:hypothetical protein
MICNKIIRHSLETDLSPSPPIYRVLPPEEKVGLICYYSLLYCVRQLMDGLEADQHIVLDELIAQACIPIDRVRVITL